MGKPRKLLFLLICGAFGMFEISRPFLFEKKQLILENKTAENQIAQFCYQDLQTGNLEPAHLSFTLKKESIQTIDFPPVRWGTKRVLCFPETHIAPLTVSPLTPTGHYIIFSDDISHQPVLIEQENWATEYKKQDYRKTLKAYSEHGNKIARVARFLKKDINSHDYSSWEREFLAERENKTREAIIKFLDRENNTGSRTPRIGLCLSGGGFRAMTASIGLLRGLDAIGLLDGISTCATLSGSSWALAPWIVSQLPITQFSDIMRTNLQEGVTGNITEHYADFLHIKADKELFGLPVSLIDFYGAGLARTLLEPFTNHRSYPLSHLEKDSTPQHHPFPLFSAATQLSQKETYSWVITSPSHTRIREESESYRVPNWGLQRTFCDGIAPNYTLEPLLGYCLGFFGSSFSLSFRDLIDHSPEFIKKVSSQISNTLFGKSDQDRLKTASWANQKFSPARIPNITYKALRAHHAAQEELALVDGGYRNNLPLLPLLDQTSDLDLVIILDNRREFEYRLSNFQNALRECAEAGYTLPSIDFESKETRQKLDQNFSVWPGSENNSVTLVYITLQKDPSYPELFDPKTAPFCSTTNFYYSPEQFDLLSGLLEHLIISHKHDLKDLISDLTSRKTSAYYPDING